MKIAIVNYTGTVGKTTIAAHLLSPRMGNAPIFAVESINETAAGLGVDVEQIKGDKFRELFRKLFALDDAIIDVGASNIEDFLDGMVKFDESHLEFDYFVIPLTSGTKEQKETISMIGTLSDFGIPAEKIRLVFNRVDADVADEFAHVVNYVRKEKNATANTEAAIFESELFDALAVKKLTVEALLKDETDYKALLKSNPDATAKEKNTWGDMHGLKALSRSVNRNLDSVFSVLFK
ncbi:plasmid stability protein StbB [Pectobacterium brasiliense]|uniref:StbB family protein n=1 Tax=Enterobacterales TaxID=91347 RepID=UPI0013570BDB|nr:MULTISPECIES: StbB family protein [Enterobacterales]MBN3201291.1 plasmid stability protein StbB [Pectobacterium brasiliense]